jgi:hypothetical protein
MRVAQRCEITGCCDAARWRKDKRIDTALSADPHLHVQLQTTTKACICFLLLNCSTVSCKGFQAILKTAIASPDPVESVESSSTCSSSIRATAAWESATEKMKTGSNAESFL